MIRSTGKARFIGEMADGILAHGRMGNRQESEYITLKKMNLK